MSRVLPFDIISVILKERRLIKERERIKKQMDSCINIIRDIGRGQFHLIDHEIMCYDWCDEYFNADHCAITYLGHFVLRELHEGVSYVVNNYQWEEWHHGESSDDDY